jgi:putative ABC transport system permease protein
VAAPVYEDWRARATTLASIGIWEYRRANINGGGDPDQVQAARASASLFRTLGVAPALGRAFTDDEDGGAPVVVISDRVWRTQFSSDPRVVGRPLRVNDEERTVIGVMPPAFAFPTAATAVWLPIAFTDGDRDRTSHSFLVVGRLSSAATVAAADDEFATIGREMAAAHEGNRGESALVTPLPAYGMASTARMLRALAGAVGLVLLIACVNVANLLIGLAVARRREFLMRVALGARLSRIARQLLAEGLLLALAGGVAGVAVAAALTRTLDTIAGPGLFALPFRANVTIGVDARVLGFATVVAFLCAVLFSLVPLIGLRRTTAVAAIGAGGRGTTRAALGARRMLVAAEVAMAIVVLAGAGLLAKSFAGLLHVDSGLDPERVIGMQVSVPQSDTYGRPERATFCEDITRAAAAPGGLFARFSAISHLPLSGANAGRGLAIDGWTPPSPDEGASASFRVVCPGYFDTLGIPMASGRDIRASDAEPVVVVNQAFADRYFPNADALGQRIKITYGENPWMRIVGVSANVRHFGLDAEVRREIFVPYRLNVWPAMTLVAKTSAPITPDAQLALRGVIRAAYPELPAGRVFTMNAVVGDSLRTRTSLLRMLLLFSGVGLVLAAVGVYGVLAYYVSMRRRELGVRVALGCTRGALVRFVMRQSAVPMIAGALVGLSVSLWTNRLLTDVLFHTGPADAGVLTAIASLVIAVGLAASWLPAHRAAGIDPTVALRDER